MEKEGKEKRAFTREKLRAPCRYEIDGETHSGFVLNLSPRGMFLQSRLRLSPGTEITIHIRELGDEPIDVLARVVHRTSSHRATSPVEKGGMGVELVSAPEAFYRLLYKVGNP